jgi:hypothetical protein
MITKTIFLASSSELKEDRAEFEIFISRKNKNLIQEDVFLEIIMWEVFLDAMSQTRLQDEYNNAVRGCDIFVMLFSNKVGQYTGEEFEAAFGQFKATNKPLIYTYFKDASTSFGNLDREHITSLWAFQDKLKKLGHFHTVYKNVDDLKLKFDQQVNNLMENGLFTQAPQQATKPPVAAMPAKAPPIIGITLHDTIIEKYIAGLNYPRKLRLYLSNKGTDIELGKGKWIADGVGLQAGKPSTCKYQVKDHLGKWTEESSFKKIYSGQWVRLYIGIDSTVPEEKLKAMAQNHSLRILRIPARTGETEVVIKIRP